MLEEKGKSSLKAKRSTSSDKKTNANSVLPKKEKVKLTKVKTFSCSAYCSIMKLGSGARFVAEKKTKGMGRKTASEWKDIFTKEKIN